MTWSLLTYVLPFALFFGLWAWLRFIITRRTTEPEQEPSTRSRAASDERDDAAPAPQRSRRAALLPIAVVLGISIVARKLLGY
jgi:hypothetical protein